MNSASDDELQNSYGGDDEARARGALDEMMRRNEPRLRGKALYLCSFDRTEADDLYGESALHFWAKRKLYVPSPAPWIAWAISVMCGCASDQRKKRRGQLASRMQPIGDSAEWIAGNETSPERIVLDKEFNSSVADCISSLESPMREVFVMHFDDERTLREVAESLQLSQAVTAAKYYKAVELLGRCLRRKGYRLEDMVDEK